MFTYTERDRWNRPVKRLDVTALTLAFMGALVGVALLAGNDFVLSGAKLAHRLVTAM